MIRIASPCVMEQLLNVLVSIVSISVIGHLGSNEMVAVSMTNQLILWLQFVFAGLATSGTVLIARMYGDKDIKGLQNNFRQNFFLSGMIGIMMLLAVLSFKDAIILTFFGHATQEIIEMSSYFFSMTIMTIPAIAFTSVINASARGVGDNKTPLYSALVANAFNLIFSVVLIIGVPVFHIPRLGITGAGIAIILARYLCLAFTYVYVIKKKSIILPEKFTLSFEKSSVWRLLRLAVPTALEQLVFQGGFVIQQTVLIGFGTAFQGGYQIGAQINGLLFAPAMGLNLAVTVLISQKLGMRDYDGTDEIVSVARKLTYTVFTAMGLLVVLFSPQIAHIFTSNAEILHSGAIFGRMFGILVIPLAYFHTMAGVLKGGGDARYLAAVSITSLWVMRILVVIVVSWLTNNGYYGVFAGVSSDFLFRSVMFHLRVRKGEWKYIRV